MCGGGATTPSTPPLRLLTQDGGQREWGGRRNGREISLAALYSSHLTTQEMVQVQQVHKVSIERALPLHNMMPHSLSSRTLVAGPDLASPPLHTKPSWRTHPLTQRQLHPTIHPQPHPLTTFLSHPLSHSPPPHATLSPSLPLSLPTHPSSPTNGPAHGTVQRSLPQGTAIGTTTTMAALSTHHAQRLLLITSSIPCPSLSRMPTWGSPSPHPPVSRLWRRWSTGFLPLPLVPKMASDLHTPTQACRVHAPSPPTSIPYRQHSIGR